MMNYTHRISVRSFYNRLMLIAISNRLEMDDTLAYVLETEKMELSGCDKNEIDARISALLPIQECNTDE